MDSRASGNGGLLHPNVIDVVRGASANVNGDAPLTLFRFCGA